MVKNSMESSGTQLFLKTVGELLIMASLASGQEWLPS